MPQDPPVQFRDRGIEEKLDERTGVGRSKSQAAKQDLERYYELLKAEDVVLPEDDAVVIWNALNGASTTHAEMMMILRQGVVSELLEDGKSKLAMTVKSWSAGQWFNVIDKCDRIGTARFSIEDLASELRKVGLC